MAALFFVYLKNGVFHGYVPNHLLRFCQTFCLIKSFTTLGTTVVQKKVEKSWEKEEEKKN